MIANYHTHTWRCQHADGSERAYVEQAIAAGIRVLGFSDHTPCVFPGGYLSYFRMLPNQAEDYFRTISDLKREYAGQIDIHIGVEAEFYPACFDGLVEMLKQYPCEYMILGQHFTYNECDGVYSGRRTAEESVLIQYVDQALEGLRTGLFTYLAHPDLLYWQGDPAAYEREMTRLCRGAEELDIPLEINLLGIMDNRQYPCDAFWRIAGQVGNRVILGCDAHEPWALDRPDIEQRGRELAERWGITLLDTVELRPIF